VSAPLTRRERRLIDAALDAFATAIAFTEVDNGVPTAHYSAADAEERHDDLRRYLTKLSRVAPDARRYARTRFARMVRDAAGDLTLSRKAP
jgi:hypothetical protein